MRRANRSYSRQLPDDAWDRPDQVAGAIIRCHSEIQNCGGARCYSEDGEDDWIANNIDLPKQGIFVDVGAGDATFWSNSKHFEEKGWTGLLIDPDPRRSYSNRTSAVDRCAIGLTNGFAQITLTSNPDLTGLRRQNGEKITVPMKTLTSALDDAGIEQVDLLCIDVEGTELDVWASLDQSRFHPKVVIVEYFTAGIGDNYADVMAAFEASGYTLVCRKKSNLIFEINK
jgi:FkbM family methyltransferase